MNNGIRLLLMLALCSLLFLSIGCASAGLGKADAPSGAVPVRLRLMGKDKASLIRILGDPDFVTFEKEKEFWGYHNRKRWYFDLRYLSGGKSEAKDLVVELSDNRAKDAYLINKGSSVGILATPLSVPD